MDQPSLRASFAKHFLRRHLIRKLRSQHLQSRKTEKVNGRNKRGDRTIPAIDIVHHQSLPVCTEQVPGKVCIVGAGAAGLMVALCLREVGFSNFDILEASDRVGGRIYTHKFPDDPRCPHNYYDIGAMRIPSTPGMQSTFSLIDYLQLRDKKVEYIYRDENRKEPNMFGFQKDIPDHNKLKKALDDALRPFGIDFDAACRRFGPFGHRNGNGIDEYSTRSYLMSKANPPLTYEEVDDAELVTTSTGLFDQGFLETVFDYYDLIESQEQGTKWYRLEGGMSCMTDAMEELIGQDWNSNLGAYTGVRVKRNSPVIAMAEEGDVIKVTTGGANSFVRQYSFVFNTTTMGALGRIDMGDLHLSPRIHKAIRTLSYDSATKVAIKFSKPWWVPLGITKGGMSTSDLPIRNVIYPSWDDGPENHTILIVSYSWAMDAIRMGSLVQPKQGENQIPSADEPIVTLCLRNLAKLWSTRRGSPSFEDLRDMYVTHHAFSWSQDPYASGAFAFYAPGQFSRLYPVFQELLCNKKLAICGEAVSAQHGWISGALDSAYASVLKWAGRWGSEKMRSTLKASKLGGAAGRHPEEVDETLLAQCY